MLGHKYTTGLMIRARSGEGASRSAHSLSAVKGGEASGFSSTLLLPAERAWSLVTEFLCFHVL